MKEEYPFPTPPEAPDPTLGQRLANSPYFWWFFVFLILVAVIFLVPSQCAIEGLKFPEKKKENLDQAPFLDQAKEMVQQADGLWYPKGGDEPYEGVVVTHHENGQRKTRAKFVEGQAVGLIEEWDANGSLLGPRFKGESKP